MPRKRMIDPGIWDSASFNSLDEKCQMGFICLFSNADDEGKGQASILAQKRGFSREEILSASKTYQAENLAHFYYMEEGLDRILLYQLPKWFKYQTINRPAPSSLPNHPAFLQIIPTQYQDRYLNKATVPKWNSFPDLIPETEEEQAEKVIHTVIHTQSTAPLLNESERTLIDRTPDGLARKEVKRFSESIHGSDSVNPFSESDHGIHSRPKISEVKLSKEKQPTRARACEEIPEPNPPLDSPEGVGCSFTDTTLNSEQQQQDGEGIEISPEWKEVEVEECWDILTKIPNFPDKTPERDRLLRGYITTFPTVAPVLLCLKFAGAKAKKRLGIENNAMGQLQAFFEQTVAKKWGPFRDAGGQTCPDCGGALSEGTEGGKPVRRCGKCKKVLR